MLFWEVIVLHTIVVTVNCPSLNRYDLPFNQWTLESNNRLRPGNWVTESDCPMGWLTSDFFSSVPKFFIM